MRSTAIKGQAIDRRTFLALAGHAAAWGATGFAAAEAGAAEGDDPLYLGARLRARGFEAAVIDTEGRDRLVLPLQARGHSFAIDAERRRAVAFARSPGRFAVAFSLDGKSEPLAIAAAEGRHFFGHGVFTPDGRLMLATENDYGNGRGVTGVYDVSASFRRIGELDSAGVGPHELVLMGDGKTVCVANGGILTHPDYPRQKLNLATMKAALTYLDIDTGDVVERVELAPELHQLSMRHMALDGAGHVWFGCQFEGDATETPPLVGRHRRGGEIELFSGPAGTLRAMRNYVGSVAVDRSGTVLATSSPAGGTVVFWDTADGRCLGARPLPDGCGVAPAPAERQILATSGRGAIVTMDSAGSSIIRAESAEAPAWDNHLRKI